MGWDSFISAVIGGLFVLAGGFLQSFLAGRKREEENKNRMKIHILQNLMGFRAALADAKTEEEKRRRERYSEPFLSALNQINVVFNDNNNVIEKYEEFYHSRLVNSPSDELLYKLIKSIHEDLNMKAPSREQFSGIIY